MGQKCPPSSPSRREPRGLTGVYEGGGSFGQCGVNGVRERACGLRPRVQRCLQLGINMRCKAFHSKPSVIVERCSPLRFVQNSHQINNRDANAIIPAYQFASIVYSIPHFRAFVKFFCKKSDIFLDIREKIL